MKVKMLFVLFLVISMITPLQAMAQNDDEGLGYRYKITYDVKDDVVMHITVLTETWVYNPNPKGENTYVSLGNPHPDIMPTYDFGMVVVDGCSILVGKGVLIRTQHHSAEKQTANFDSLFISQSVKIKDFVQDRETAIDLAGCNKKVK